uniref:Uncharacterized protein n=1 Tax=Hyaloperonospora arabidopsidis (strain Emoy2) TaxID=559515 RepID=M4BDV8_HYAAE
MQPLQSLFITRLQATHKRESVECNGCALQSTSSRATSSTGEYWPLYHQDQDIEEFESMCESWKGSGDDNVWKQSIYDQVVVTPAAQYLRHFAFEIDLNTNGSLYSAVTG